MAGARGGQGGGEQLGEPVDGGAAVGELAALGLGDDAEDAARVQARAQAAQGPAEQGAAEGILGQALGRLFAVAEAYPELQADENFRQLQEELAQTENRIAVSRQVYNDTVLTYNTAIQTVPGVFFAGPLGFTKRDFFEVEEEAREAPRVTF